MPKIFISYRRDDNIYAVNYIFTAMATQFGRGNIIFDVDSIPLGIDFREYLDETVGQCDVVLAVIGDKWLPLLNSRREDTNDYVRAEIEAALRRDIPVVPVLIDKAVLPTEEELTKDIRALAVRNATEVRGGKYLEDHLSRLVKQIDFLLQGEGLKEIQPLVYDTHGRPFSTGGNHIDDELLETLSKRNRPAVGVDGPISLNFMGEKDFTDLDLRQLQRIPEVQELLLDSTYITNKGLRYLHSFTNLRKLDLSETDIDDRGLENLKPLTHLEELNLCTTNLTDAGLRHLETLTNLQHLDISCTEITGVGLQHLRPLIELSTLNLYSTEITNVGQNLAELSSLRSLNVSYTQFNNADLQHLSSASNLRDLNLAQVDITDTGLKYLTEMTQLQNLDISYTQISDAGLIHIGALTNLHKLNINDTNISEDGRQKLMRALPSTRIIRP